MDLPFTRAEFFGVFREYNTALWPVVVALWVATLHVMAHAWRAPDDRTAVGYLLAFHWAWAASAYHALFFTEVNPAAWVFAALFAVQAALVWRGVAGWATRARPGRRQRWWGLALTAYALLYPALTLWQGHVYPAAPTFGVPCPTLILTAGLLAFTYRDLPWTTIVIPVAWSIVGASGAWFFDVRADWLLPVAGLSLLAQARRRAAPTA